MLANKMWKVLSTCLTQTEIDSIYFTHRKTLDAIGRIMLDLGREGRNKTVFDLIELGLV